MNETGRAEARDGELELGPPSETRASRERARRVSGPADSTGPVVAGGSTG